jgi:hypothetical protein
MNVFVRLKRRTSTFDAPNAMAGLILATSAPSSTTPDRFLTRLSISRSDPIRFEIGHRAGKCANVRFTPLANRARRATLVLGPRIDPNQSSGRWQHRRLSRGEAHHLQSKSPGRRRAVSWRTCANLYLEHSMERPLEHSPRSACSLDSLASPMVNYMLALEIPRAPRFEASRFGLIP